MHDCILYTQLVQRTKSVNNRFSIHAVNIECIPNWLEKK